MSVARRRTGAAGIGIWVVAIGLVLPRAAWGAGPAQPESEIVEPPGEAEPGPVDAAPVEADPEAEPGAAEPSEDAADPEAEVPADAGAVDEEPDPAPEPTASPDPEPSETAEPAATKTPARPLHAPSPAAVRNAPERITVGVGLSPEAPGTKSERALLDRLERSLSASKRPLSEVRHISAGAGEPRTICRERRDDLVVMVGYLPERDDPVVLAHDCRLDRPLGVRSADAATSEALLGALWEEHEELIRQGVRERRTVRRLSPTARGVIIASVAVVVVGVAVGFLVANALRKERVVVTVSP